MKNFIKKHTFILFSLSLSMILVLTPVCAWGRKLITKSISGSFWTNNYMEYSLNVTAGITYNDSGKITDISDLLFKNISCKSTVVGGACNIGAVQKSGYYSGNTATYVATITRNAMGFYVDRVDYTLKYKTTDSGVPYSLNDDMLILESIEVSEPYDIQILNNDTEE